MKSERMGASPRVVQNLRKHISLRYQILNTPVLPLQIAQLVSSGA